MPDLAVRTADRDDHTEITAVLGRAFQVEPVYHWLFPDPAVRARRVGPLIGTMLRHLHRRLGLTEVAMVDGAIVGAAVWDRPGTVGPPDWRIAFALPGMLRAMGRELPRLVRLGEVMERARPAEPHWYLSHLGADPERQRSGVGSALLRSMLPRSDADGTPAYLECSDANVGYYERFGFAVRDTVVVDETLSCRAMWRIPGPSPA
jgi:ribosomal protein S18 acetylase RimI-like enzyme